jgi:dienelactone hydrolase
MLKNPTGYALSLIIAATLVVPSTARPQSTAEHVSPIPQPTGRYVVGTSVAYLVDRARTDSDFPAGRPVNLQLWYPAARAGNITAPYLVEPHLEAALLASQYYGIDSAALESWGQLPTHAYRDAAPAPGRFPALAFSVGQGVIRANYTSFAEELASWGYIVALVESPLQGLLVRPDGAVVTDTAGIYGDPDAHRRGVVGWSGDISFVLDQLLAGTPASQFIAIAPHLDSTRIGALGHSSGGIVAIAACESDRRVRACVDMDGGVAGPEQQPLADFVSSGITKPTLFLRSQPLYDDTTLTRRGMTREQWVKRGEEGKLAYEGLIARSTGPILVAHIAGTGHFSYSDAPFVMPSAIARFGGRIIAAERGWTVATSALRAFFDRELNGKGNGLISLAAQMPELTVEGGAR